MAVERLGERDIPIADLTFFPGNARRGNLEEIRKSVRRLGQYRSVVVRDTGDALVILAGNHTVQAMAAEGMTAAHCGVIRCTDDDATRISIADNRLSDIAEDDDRLLAELLATLDGDYEGTGFDPQDVDRLADSLTGPEPPDEFPDYDDDIPTEYECPSCHYQWSGKPK